MLAIRQAVNAPHSVLSQGTVNPNHLARSRFTEPYSALNMPRQVRAVMYWGTAHGSMSKVLKTDFPRMFLFRTSASETPITT